MNTRWVFLSTRSPAIWGINLFYDRIISTKNYHLCSAYKVLGTGPDTVHMLSHLIQIMILLVYAEHIICSIGYIILEVSYRPLTSTSCESMLYESLFPFHEKPKSTQVKSFTQSTELSNSRGTVSTQISIRQAMCTWKHLFLSVNVWRADMCVSVYWGWYLRPSINQYHLFNLIYLKTLWAAKLTFVCSPSHPVHAWHISHMAHATWIVGTLPPCLCKGPP